MLGRKIRIAMLLWAALHLIAVALVAVGMLDAPVNNDAAGLSVMVAIVAGTMATMGTFFNKE